MLGLVNVLLQHRCKDLGNLRELQTHCTECTVRGGWCHFRSTTRRGESRQPQPSASQSLKEKSSANEATNVYFSRSGMMYKNIPVFYKSTEKAERRQTSSEFREGDKL